MDNVTSTPDLTAYDVILVNSSAGKDSQATLDVVVEAARAAGVADRLVVVHADLGRVEWKGTRELAAEHAAHYGLRFEVVARPQGDLLDQIEARGMFPSKSARFCTSDQKTAQVRTLITRLAAEVRAAGGPAVPRILNVLGMRAEESDDRAAMPAFEYDRRASSGARHVDRWLPIHAWTVEQVWTRIAAAGTRPHEAYALGMSRLSCAFCVFASRSDLLVSARANPELLDQYVAVEVRIGHRFTDARSIESVRDEVRSAA